MSRAILVYGESGSGKTTSLRGLDPAKTYYIDADGKGLSWKGWRQQFNAEHKNYKKLTNGDEILQAMVAAAKAADESGAPRYDVLVIDTINGSMVATEMSRSKESGYGKWVDLADFGYRICRLASELRDDMTVIITGHAETITEDTGYVKTRLKTNGRKLEKMVLESLFTTVLLADYKDGDYVFHTRLENSTCKTPLGAFDADQIPNDITLVLEALADY